MVRNTASGWPGGDTHAGNFGRFGERCAREWYLAAGCRILDANWRCRSGELDLVVADGPDVVFVEVKARTSNRFGTGAEAVDARKRQRLRVLAGQWLAASHEHFAELRFDVVDVDRNGAVEVYRDCF